MNEYQNDLRIRVCSAELYRRPSTLRSSGRASRAVRASSIVRDRGSSEFSQALIVPRDLTPSSSRKASCEYAFRFRHARNSLPFIAVPFVSLGRKCFCLARDFHTVPGERRFGAGLAHAHTSAYCHKFFLHSVQKVNVRFSNIWKFSRHNSLLFCSIRVKVNASPLTKPLLR